MTKIGVALFGVGRAGTIHLKNVLHHQRVRLMYVVDLHTTHVADVIDAILGEQGEKEITHQIVSADETDRVLNDSGVSMVIITTPTHHHEHLVVSALQHGKHVFCEKPLAESIPATVRAYGLAAERSLHLLAAFQRRFDPSVRDLRRRLLEGQVGRVHVVKSCSRDSPLPSMDYLRISGGIFHDCAVHDIDTICWMLAEYPHTVYASGAAHLPAVEALGDADTVVIVLTFPSGTIATIDLSRDSSSYGYDQRLEVFGDQGMLQMANETPTAVQFAGEARPGQGVGTIKASFPTRYAQAYRAELDHFVQVLRGEELEGLSVTVEAAVRVSLIAEAAQRSWKSALPIRVADLADQLNVLL